LAQHRGLPCGEMQCYGTARAVTENVSLFYSQFRERGGYIIRHPFDGQRAVNIRGATMPLQLERNNLSRFRQPGQDPSKRGPDPRERAVEHYQRLALARTF